jgi:hypothetical protein
MKYFYEGEEALTMAWNLAVSNGRAYERMRPAKSS